MSDQSDVPATEPEEIAEPAVEATPDAPPWGNDFDAERAWKTIQNLRQYEKQAKEFERIQSDDEARAEWLKSQGYEFAEDEAAEDSDEPEFEDDDPVAPLEERLTKAEQWQAQQDQEKADALIRSDLDAINQDSEWDLDEKDRRWIVNEAAQNPKGFTRDALEQAHREYIERLEGLASKAVERAKTPKKAAARVPAGQAATGVKSTEDMTRRELDVHMAERARALEQG